MCSLRKYFGYRLPNISFRCSRANVSCSLRDMTMLCICSGVNSFCTGTAIAPYVSVARNATAQWLLLRPHRAILSPRFTPLFSNMMWSFSIFRATSWNCSVAPL